MNDCSTLKTSIREGIAGPLIAFVFENPSYLVSPKYVIEYNNGRMMQGTNAIIPDFANGEHVQHVLFLHQLEGSNDRQRSAKVLFLQKSELILMEIGSRFWIGMTESQDGLGEHSDGRILFSRAPVLLSLTHTHLHLDSSVQF